jgi:nucleoside-diphosphate-sugar epimerase
MDSDPTAGGVGRMRVLLTGHEGYIGSELSRALQEAGHTVRGLDAGYYRGCTLDSHPYARGIPGVSKDVRDVTEDDLQGVDAVVHLAALCNDPLGDLNAEWTHDINHRATVRLATLAKEAGVSRFLFASSCSVYGDVGVDDELTENSRIRPLTAYAASKARSEEGIAKLAAPGFSPVSLRNGSVYGLSRRFRADIVLNNLVCWAVTTGRVTMLTDGSPWRPMVHVEDVAAAFAHVLTAPRDVIHNQVFNVGARGENYQVRQLAEIVRDAVRPSVLAWVPHASGDSRDYRVSFEKLLSDVPAYTPRWTVAAGARQVRDGLIRAGVTLEEFQGPRFTRLARLRQLLETGGADRTLRMLQPVDAVPA